MSRLPHWPLPALAFVVAGLIPWSAPCSQVPSAPGAVRGGDAQPAAEAVPEQVLEVGTVHPVSGPAFADGVIVIGGGRILAIGPRAEVAVPANVPVISLPTGHAYPGLVDAWSRAFLPAAGMGEGAAGTDIALGLDRYALDGKACVRAGITTAHVLPVGTGKWLGTGAAIRPTEDGFAPFAAGATGAEVLRLTGDAGQHRVARHKDLLDLGRTFEEAEAYGKLVVKHKDALAKYEKDWKAYLEALRTGAKPEPKSEAKPAVPEGGEQASSEVGAAAPAKPTGPKRPTYPRAVAPDPQKEALQRVAAGEVRLWIEAQRREELRAALDLVAAQGLRNACVLGALEATPLLDSIVEVGAGVVLAPTGLPEKLDGEPVGEHLAARLHERGIPFAIASGSIKRAAELPLMAASCVGAGVPEDAAVRAITLTPAELIGIAKDTGSLERGKRADIVVASAPILRSEARVLRVLADGRTVYQGR